VTPADLPPIGGGFVCLPKLPLQAVYIVGDFFPLLNGICL